jgi:hypothetical protein
MISFILLALNVMWLEWYFTGYANIKQKQYFGDFSTAFDEI